MQAEASGDDWDRPGRVVARLARQVELTLVGLDLSLPQYRVMMLLASQSEAASALAEHLTVTRPSITSVVDGLVARDLVVRQGDSSDRRRVKHVLTPAGRQLLGAADDALDRRFEEIAAHLDDPDLLRSATSGLPAWRRGLDAYRAAVRARLADRLGVKA